MDYTIRIGGEAGQGLQTIGSIIARLFARTGYHVFTHQDYMSRIRGGHNFYQLRLADRPVSASRDMLDILIALDKNTVELHKDMHDLHPEHGILLYDAATIGQKYEGERFLDVPFRKIALDISHAKVMENVVAVGAVLGMLGMDLTLFNELVAETFRKKGEDVVRQNKECARAGFDHARANCPRCAFQLGQSTGKKYMLMDGISAVAAGALLSGVKFYSAYPMTPATGILTWLAGHAEKYGLVVEQAEDEIAAINMAIGASYAGVRSMTGSSGGGFALMVEGLSLAAMTETPIVIFMGQRPGPATGFPTRTEQGDLLYVLYTAHGEFPRFVFAPGTPEQAFYLTNKAFEMAEKYQMPAIILSDTYLSDSEWTYEGLDTSRLVHNDYRLRGEALEKLTEYKRHAFTETGVTPLAVPGKSRHLVVTDSDEHDEEGHIVEDAPTRVRMVEKRLLKRLPLMQAEIDPPEYYGGESPDVVLVGWGSNYGIMREAVDAFRDGHSIGMLHFSQLSPFPTTDKFNYLDVLNSAKKTICVENNATGQFARLLRQETGFQVTDRMNRFDGRPFTLESFSEELNDRIKGLRRTEAGMVPGMR